MLVGDFLFDAVVSCGDLLSDSSSRCGMEAVSSGGNCCNELFCGALRNT